MSSRGSSLTRCPTCATTISCSPLWSGSWSEPSLSWPISSCVSALSAAAAAEKAETQEEIGHESDGSDHDPDQSGEQDIVVAHVGHLVSDDPLELIAVHLVQQPLGDSDG